jgi:hypothetical protein
VSAELIRRAVQGDRVIATLRCFDDAAGTSVEAEVLPPNAAQPVRRGPYRFASAHEAFRFVQEAMLAFEYLGCTIG